MNEYDENEDTKFLELVNELKWSITYGLIAMSRSDFKNVKIESLQIGERIISESLRPLKNLIYKISGSKLRKKIESKNDNKFFPSHNVLNNNN
jgi:hypothetical protein